MTPCGTIVISEGFPHFEEWDKKRANVAGPRFELNDRPGYVDAATGSLVFLGLVAAYTTFCALAPMPHAAFPVFKPVAVLAPCAAVVLISVALACGLLFGQLWAWLASLTWALVAGGVPVFFLNDRLRGGLSVLEAISLSPHHADQLLLAAGVVVLLLPRRTRGWCACAHRHGPA
jgi:hypothetical protein